MLIPFIVLTVLSAIAFWWLFDPQTPLFRGPQEDGLHHANIDFLGDIWNHAVGDFSQYLARRTVRGDHAARRSANGVSSLYEAATIDGATPWQRFRSTTYLLLTPMIAVVMTFSALFTFTDFELIWVMTCGGRQRHPPDGDALLSARDSGRPAGRGSAISTAMILFLLAAILVSWFGLQRRKWQQGESND